MFNNNSFLLGTSTVCIILSIAAIYSSIVKYEGSVKTPKLARECKKKVFLWSVLLLINIIGAISQVLMIKGVIR